MPDYIESAQAILEDILTPEQYGKNVATVPGSRNVVEYAVKLPVEDGGFALAGVAFPGAEIALDFLDPGGATALLPSGRPLDRLTVPGLGEIEATLLYAGNPTVFVRAAAAQADGCRAWASVLLIVSPRIMANLMVSFVAQLSTEAGPSLLARSTPTMTTTYS